MSSGCAAISLAEFGPCNAEVGALTGERRHQQCGGRGGSHRARAATDVRREGVVSLRGMAVSASLISACEFRCPTIELGRDSGDGGRRVGESMPAIHPCGLLNRDVGVQGAVSFAMGENALPVAREKGPVADGPCAGGWRASALYR